MRRSLLKFLWLNMSIFFMKSRSEDEGVTEIGGTTSKPKSSRLELIPMENKIISVSGISSGAVAATQFYLSNSRMIHGLAIYASLQYQCGSGSIFKLIPCLMGRGDAGTSMEVAQQFSQTGMIDSLKNLERKRHFIYHGTNDKFVNFDNGQLVSQFFQEYSNFVMFRQSDSIHSMPSKTCGIPCTQFSPTYGAGQGCAKCNFSAVFEGLNYIFTFKLTEPQALACRSSDNMEGIEFVDQSEFLIPFDARTSMLADAILYTPPRCRVQPSKCKLHVAFHGCRHSIQNDGLEYIRCSGYLETADVNDFIVLFPQTKQSSLDATTLFHCWDLHGYTGQLYGTRYGSQNQVVLRMVHRILGLEDLVLSSTDNVTNISRVSSLYNPVEGIIAEFLKNNNFF